MATNTPWGVSQAKFVVTRGLTLHSTASHGGFLVSKGFAKKFLTEAAIKVGKPYSNYLAYEEDCDCDIILLEIPAARRFLENPELTDEELIKGISLYNADYLLERGIKPEPEAYAVYLQRKDDDQRRAAKCPDLIVSALGLDDKVCKVYTADGSHHFVTLESYQARGSRVGNNLSDCTLVQDYVQTSYLYY